MSESCGVGPSVAERMPKCRCPADMYQALVCVIDSSDHSAWLPGVLDNEKAEHLDWSRRVLRLYLSKGIASLASPRTLQRAQIRP